MIGFAMSELAACLGADHVGADPRIDRVSTDTRTLRQGDLFIALVGPNFDGHAFLDQARAAGAAGAMVTNAQDCELPQLVVADTRIGLGRLGTLWRDTSRSRVVGLTGSNGKTTLKEMLAAILAQRGSVLATEGNLNNDIGMPLTLTRLQHEDFAVIEMGANHAGEIDYLSRLAKPEIVVINNVGRAHLEGFGSLEGVAHAKSEIVNGLQPGGCFVYNADDAFAGLWQELGADLSCLRFGTSAQADVRLISEQAALIWNESGFVNRFAIRIGADEQVVDLPLAGAHNRMNAVAAAAVVHVLEFDLATIAAGLAHVPRVAGRLCPVSATRGIRLVDDTYNANPDSVAAAIEVLVSAPGRRVLVLGDLAELGPEAQTLHAEIGTGAKQAGIDTLFTLGPLSAAAATAFGPGAHACHEYQALVDELDEFLVEGDAVLIKGSRSAHMERIVAALAQESVAC